MEFEMKPSPAFQFYPHDFLVGTADLTAEEVGGYMRLLCYQWTKGFVPKDDRKLMQLSGISDGLSMGNVSVKFRLCEDGNLRNDRLEKVRLEQEEYREKQRENGLKGGNPNFKKGKHNPYYNRPLSSGDNPAHNPPDNPKINPSPSSSSNIYIPTISKETENGNSGSDLALQGPRPRVKTVPPSRHALLKLWNAEYPEAHGGEAYHHTRNDDYPMDELLSKFTPEKIMDCARNGWKSKTDFIRNTSSTFDGLNKNWNKIINDSKNAVLKPTPVFVPSSRERSGL